MSIDNSKLEQITKQILMNESVDNKQTEIPSKKKLEDLGGKLILAESKIKYILGDVKTSKPVTGILIESSEKGRTIWMTASTTPESSEANYYRLDEKHFKGKPNDDKKHEKPSTEDKLDRKAKIQNKKEQFLKKSKAAPKTDEDNEQKKKSKPSTEERIDRKQKIAAKEKMYAKKGKKPATRGKVDPANEENCKQKKCKGKCPAKKTMWGN